MSALSVYGWLIGGALTLFGVLSFTSARKTRRLLDALPRHRSTAVLLTLVNVIWVTGLLYVTPLGRFEVIKSVLFLLAPGIFYMVVTYMDDLLGPRMLGGFLLLLATPILDAARWHMSPWRLVVTLLVYVAVVWGMILLLSPYRFRHLTEWMHGQLLRQRVASLVAAGLGVGILVLAATVY
jgi:hypothetical protein